MMRGEDIIKEMKKLFILLPGALGFIWFPIGFMVVMYSNSPFGFYKLIVTWCFICYWYVIYNKIQNERKRKMEEKKK